MVEMALLLILNVEQQFYYKPMVALPVLMVVVVDLLV
jgi:hypothetical protein